jgi:hypothetical protein
MKIWRISSTPSPSATGASGFAITTGPGLGERPEIRRTLLQWLDSGSSEIFFRDRFGFLDECGAVGVKAGWRPRRARHGSAVLSS